MSSSNDLSDGPSWPRRRFIQLSRSIPATVAALSLVVSAGAAMAEDKIEMSIGYQSLWATAGELFEALRHTNILELNGIEAEFETFTYGGPLGEGYVAGHIENVIGADAPVLRGLARRPGIVVHRTHDWRWGVLAVPEFEGDDLADLRGGKLAGPFGTTVFPRTVRKLVDAGIAEPFQELTIINQDVTEQTSALQGKLVDAIVTWDPTLEKLIREGIGKPLYLGKPGEGMGWQGLSRDFLDEFGEDGGVRFLKSWIMAIWWVSNNMDQAQAWFAETSRIPTEMLKVSQQADRYLKEPVADITEIDLMITESDIADAQAVLDFQVEHGLMSNRTDVSTLVDMKYLKRAQEEIAAGDHPPLSEIKIAD